MFQANQTAGMQVYLEGKGLIGVANIKLPVIKFSTEKLSGAGILGEIDLPLDGITESMELEIKFKSLISDMFNLMNISGKQLEFYSSVNGIDTATGGIDQQQLHITVRGAPKEADLGSIEVGKLMDSSFKIECTTLKVESGGKILCEFDKLNNVFKLLGKNLLAKFTENLAL